MLAVVFLMGLALGLHWPVAAVQAQQGGAVQEYRLSNGVICYTLPTASNSFSCVYGPGLAPAGQQ
jgi:hypothetical protein